jgi:hypothetical protein
MLIWLKYAAIDVHMMESGRWDFHPTSLPSSPMT